MLSIALFAMLTAGSPDLAPGAVYDPKIPTIKAVLGYDHGEEISTGEGFVTYLKALEAASSGRAKVIEYARSWEGRPLVVMIVGSAERLAALDTIKADMKKLADPRGQAAADLEAIVNRSPVITWLVHGVHGNEISSGDAALAEAYHLLAAKNDPGVDTILRESLVLIDRSALSSPLASTRTGL